MPTGHLQSAPDRRRTHEAARLAKRLRHAVGCAIPDYLADTDLFDVTALDARADAPCKDAHAWLSGEP